MAKTLDDVVSILEKMDGRLAGIEDEVAEIGAVAEDVRALRTEASAVATAVLRLTTDYGQRIARIEAVLFPPKQ